MTRLLFLASAAAALFAADTVPFAANWRENPASAANVSFLLQAPAGKTGFIKVAGGHLVRPDGSRFRIWGMNITGAATLPAKEEAPAYAAHLARFGVNCIRFHFLDLRAPAGLIDNTRDDTGALDPQQLDKLDFFVSELKKRGIYTNLNLNVARAYKPGDGVRDHELLGYGKAITYYDERLLELQREYARQLLIHRNAYTGNEYRNEPAVALVELVNENSIVESWFSNRLLGKNTSKTSGTWSDIPTSYEEALTAKYHAWLKAKGFDPVARLRRDQFDSAPADRFLREAEFYMELERTYFRQMGDYLKKDLGVKPLVLGTSDHNHGNTGYPLLSSTAQLDVVDGHVYWQHPSYQRDPATGRTTAFSIRNTPMVNDPLRSTVVELSRSAVAGKPYTVSEVNHPFPAEYAAEGIPILAAYAAFHDWDGIFWYTFSHSLPSKWEAVQTGHFDFRADPVKMAQVAAGAVAFLRGDIRPARTSVPRSYSMDQVRESIRLPRKEAPYFTPGFPLSTPLRHTTRIASFTTAAGAGSWKDEGDAPYASDTGELVWRTQSGASGLVTIDTPRSQALIGFVKANAQTTTNLAAEVSNDHCALTLSSLDGKPIAQSARLLLTTGARVENTGMTWDEKRTTLTNWGKEPTRIEPVTGTVTFRNLAKASAVVVTPLDAAGKALAAAVSAKKTAVGWTAPIGAPPTAWYAVAVRR
jgi:hypothetical protein